MCTSLLPAWQLDSGEVVFVERGSIRRQLTLPCGQCMECRLERSRQWAVRCFHESQLYPFNVFLTLTYDSDSLPPNSSLRYRDFQLFLKRLRKFQRGIRYYMCGEYGEALGRPHYHACMFNCFFADRLYFRTLPSGSKIYTSAQLSKLWPHGFSSIGDVTFESAAYVARYICKKITGPAADSPYVRLDHSTGELIPITPEFTHMSLKPGIGANWFAKYRDDTFGEDHDYVVVRGVKMRPPKYYDNLLKSADDFMSDYIEYLRFADSQKRDPAESSPARVAARAEVLRARLSVKKRTLL